MTTLGQPDPPPGRWIMTAIIVSLPIVILAIWLIVAWVMWK